jgi:hypothetical protein
MTVINDCSHDPRLYKGFPVGQYHCPECGEMVVAGLPHPQSVSEFDNGEDVTALEILDALENLVIAIECGWDLDGVLELSQNIINKARRGAA